MPKMGRGEIVGERRGGLVVDAAEHFYRCAECGGWVDMRDLASVFDHEPGGDHPKSDQPEH